MSSASSLDALAGMATEDLEMELNLEDVLEDIADLAVKVEIPKTFGFWMSSPTLEDLDKYSGLCWSTQKLVRHSEGETIPKASYNEAVVFRDFFLVGF